MKTYKVFLKNGVRFVLTQPKNREPLANFENTNMALAGVLKSGDTMEDFRMRQAELSNSHFQKNKSLFAVHGQLEYRAKIVNQKNARL